jgi:hypothetical protein
MKLLFSLFFSLLIVNALIAQENPVLVKELQGNYVGKLKKGLANGKGVATGTDKYEGYFRQGYPEGRGTYTWQNGDAYTGKMSHGKMNGEGSLKFTINAKDSIISGIFEEGKYIGPKPLADLKIQRLTNAASITAIKTSPTVNDIYVYITRDGRSASIGNLTFHANTGTYYTTESYIFIENYQLPVTVTIKYQIQSRLNSTLTDVTAEFLIQNPGQFKVEIKNN